MSKDKVVLTLAKYKHSKSEEAVVELVAQEDESICPVKKMRKYLKSRGSKKGPLFIDKNCKPLSKYKFNQLLKKSCTSAGLPKFTSHCFRIGGASLAAQQGRSDAEIRLLTMEI